MSEEIVENPVILDEVFKSNFSIFDTYEDVVKNDQIKTITYIELMSHELEKNLAGIDLFKVFPHINGIITSTENEINAILIDYDRSKFLTEPDPIHEVYEMTPEQIESVSNSYQTTFDGKRRELNDNIRSYLSNAQNRLRQYNSYMSELVSSRQELESLALPDATPMLENLKKVFADPRWKFKRFSNNNSTLEFIFTDEIINTHINANAGVNLRVNLGKFGFKVKINSGFNFKITYEGDNIRVGDIYHPHVSDNQLCLGNMSELWTEGVQSQDIFSLCNIAFQIMTNYNDSDPFSPLVNFAGQSAQVQPSGTTVSNDPRHQEVTCDECGHDYEVEFDPEGGSDYRTDYCPECEHEEEFEYQY